MSEITQKRTNKSSQKKDEKGARRGRAGDQFEVGNWHFALGGRREITVINSGEKLSGRRRWAENYNTSIILYHSRGANNELHWTCDTFQHQNGWESKFPIYLLHWWIAGLDILWRYEATYIEKRMDWTKSLSSAHFNDLLDASWNFWRPHIFCMCTKLFNSISQWGHDLGWKGGGCIRSDLVTNLSQTLPNLPPALFNNHYNIQISFKLFLIFSNGCLQYCMTSTIVFIWFSKVLNLAYVFDSNKQIMFYFEKSNQEVCALEGSKYCNFPLVLTSLSGWLHNRMNIWTWQRMNILRELLLFKYFQLFSFVPKISQLCMNNLKQQRSLLLFNSCKNQKRKYRSSCTTIL